MSMKLSLHLLSAATRLRFVVKPCCSAELSLIIDMLGHKTDFG